MKLHLSNSGWIARLLMGFLGIFLTTTLAACGNDPSYVDKDWNCTYACSGGTCINFGTVFCHDGLAVGYGDGYVHNGCTVNAESIFEGTWHSTGPSTASMHFELPQENKSPTISFTVGDTELIYALTDPYHPQPSSASNGICATGDDSWCPNIVDYCN